MDRSSGLITVVFHWLVAYNIDIFSRYLVSGVENIGLVVNALVDHLVRFTDAWYTTGLDSHMVPTRRCQLPTLKTCRLAVMASSTYLFHMTTKSCHHRRVVLHTSSVVFRKPAVLRFAQISSVVVTTANSVVDKCTLKTSWKLLHFRGSLSFHILGPG